MDMVEDTDIVMVVLRAMAIIKKMVFTKVCQSVNYGMVNIIKQKRNCITNSITLFFKNLI